MNEYLVIFTDSDGEQTEQVYHADAPIEFKAEVMGMIEGGYAFQIYQLVTCQVTWAEEYAEGKANAKS